ncbi:MAG: phosphoglucosamine mutase [Clostridia bacterium]|nr:phosphoglucosamine mutase [Clostridia bacterium]
MGIFFGTDGLRGRVNIDLNEKTIYQFGRAFGTFLKQGKVIIGTDTRISSDLFLLSFSAGLISAGINVTSVCVCPTAAISYLTKKLQFDAGVVITSSHNPAEFNGIKLFNKVGEKFSECEEIEIEKNLIKNNLTELKKLGKFEVNEKLKNIYVDFLVSSTDVNLTGKKIALDLSNGSACSIAEKVFNKLGAKVYAIGKEPNGMNINENVGALHIEQLQRVVTEKHADFGFAFDGDADRVIAIDELGNIVDGDKILYLFAKNYKKLQKNKPATIVGTVQTNLKIEQEIKKLNMNFVKTDVGDKNVSEKLKELNETLGGEQAGHVFQRNKLQTGDGILNAITIAKIVVESKKPFSKHFNFKLYPSITKNFLCENKYEILKNEKLCTKINELKNILNSNGRILIRASGTEPVVRVLVESKEKGTCEKCLDEISKCIELIQGENLCVE